MANGNKGKGLLSSITNALHVTTETFILIVSLVFVVGAAAWFAREMFFASPVKDIYMNWEDITYVSCYFDEDSNEQLVSVTIESVEGMPSGITVNLNDLSQSKACPTIISYTETVPIMMGDTLVLPAHFDSVYGYVREYNAKLREEE